MEKAKSVAAALALTALLAIAANFISGLIPYQLISASVFALLIGMLLNPLLTRYKIFSAGLGFVSKRVLKLAIILMGVTLSFQEIFHVGKYSLIVMCFTLVTAFGGGYLLGRAFGMNWKLSGLISAGTGICGGSAIAAIAPTIDAEDRDVAYAISATFIFDVVMVILFPLMGRYFGMSDIGYGLWAGTAVNDTSSVVAAGYAFSEAAGGFAVVVKLTRTLSIIPAVLIFSMVNERLERKKAAAEHGVDHGKRPINWSKIFPWFILLFLGMVAVRSTGIISPELAGGVSKVSKFLMVMALGAIGCKTNFKAVAKSGLKPMVHGFLISALVVVVSFLAQLMLGQM